MDLFRTEAGGEPGEGGFRNKEKKEINTSNNKESTDIGLLKRNHPRLNLIDTAQKKRKKENSQEEKRSGDQGWDE